jgi:hypothetical protein
MIWFSICGIAGAFAGIGQRFDQFDSVEDVQTALLVRLASPTQVLPLTYNA